MAALRNHPSATARNRDIRRAVFVTLVSAGALLIAGCSGRIDKDMLGSAVIEAQTYQIGPTVQGQLTAMYADEGGSVKVGELLAMLDTIPYRLQLDEITVSGAELQQQIANGNALVEVAKSDVRGAKRELDRIRALVDKGSAPSQQKDELETQNEGAQFRLNAATAALAATVARRKTIEAKQAEILDLLRRCRVLSPVSGTVITRYRSLGENAGPAAPIFEVATYDTVWADFFVPQTVLGSLKVGQGVRIRVDTGDGSQKARFVPATVSWISDEAEFSPKNVQTREARNELVFRIRARAVNTDRFLKRGLPVEVWR